MQVEGTGSLVITFDPEHGEALTKVDLNQYLGKHTFSLKQVSSSNGIDFKGANFNPLLTGGVPVYSDDVDNKFLSTGFYIQSQGKDVEATERQIILDPTSFIDLGTNEVKPSASEPDASEALRISVIVESANAQTKTFIFCKKRRLCSDKNNSVTEIDQQNQIYHLAAANVDKKPGGVEDVVPAGTEIFTDFSTANPTNTLNEAAIKSTICYDIQKGIAIATMSHNDKIKISLNVWLEGCDPSCVNEINSKELKMLLKFNQQEITKTQK